MINIKTPLENIPLINAKYHKVLEKIGLKTVEDFLFYFPFRYDDFSKIVSLEEKYLNEVITVEGKIIKTKLTRIFRRKMTIVEIVIQDKNNMPLKAVWFNQPYIAETLKEGEEVRLSGKLGLDKKRFSMLNPAWEKSSRDATNTGRLVPIYSETKGLTSKWIRWQMKMFLEKTKIDDMIPPSVLQKFNLPGLKTALAQIHFPTSQEKLHIAQKRFAFQEMLLIQLKSLQTKSQWESANSLQIKFDEKLIKTFVSGLPFKLTNAQRKAAFEILKDLEKNRPMNRLLNGDVGSGKTVVAAVAALQTMKAGYQVSLMAPTEVLARQHFLKFSDLLRDYNIKIALLTGSYKEINNFQFPISNFQPASPKLQRGESNPNFQNSNFKIDSKFKIKNSKLSIPNLEKISRSNLLSKIKDGEINLVIGTHAIIQKDVAFKKLALTIIDEQHRFGVAQRAYLQQDTMQLKDGLKQSVPHLLSMTATPIPRTLAIAFSGNLDISILDEMPKNRKKIITQIISPQKRNSAYEFIRSQINSERQVFVILPLVEESKIMTEIKAAVQEHARLSKDVFPEFNLGLMHGKLKAKEKEKIMQDFSDKKLDILVSTSVVEVGIDIPNASVMIIEDADRFGLSQLHQFRGRVGRAEHQSYCFLFTNSNSNKSAERLKTLEKSNDGFEIAEKDLKLRGPGQFFGTIQSGLPDIAMENLTNIKLIKFARAEALEILKSDLELKKHPLLKDALRKFQEKIHLE
jgi:ATP-dependent DNA helicase RecG